MGMRSMSEMEHPTTQEIDVVVVVDENSNEVVTADV